ncbi:unnamed protein product [Gongylonema pulchrum]|uniref:Focal_AT domain-containing protein n=1 Tax=Gongylonema pulchrum TaxID=637853 RepID=A0A183CX08_9BILA|nr:unnamed protein product [Gongylonema pulchrum]
MNPLLPESNSNPVLPYYPGSVPSPYGPAVPTLPQPTDQLQGRTFICHMNILNQANQAYTDHNRYEYREASQMILSAVSKQCVKNELKQSVLQQYLENVQILELRTA